MSTLHHSSVPHTLPKMCASVDVDRLLTCSIPENIEEVMVVLNLGSLRLHS